MTTISRVVQSCPIREQITKCNDTKSQDLPTQTILPFFGSFAPRLNKGLIFENVKLLFPLTLCQINVSYLKTHAETGKLFANWLDLDGKTPLHHAAIAGQINKMRHLLAMGGNLFALTHEKESVLHFAVFYGHIELLDFLFTQPYHQLLEEADSDGKTPLHRAVWGEQKEQVVNLLLTKGANVNARNKYGYTPLHWAAKHGHFESVRLLLENGADPLSTNDTGDMPIDLALRYGQDRLVCYLMDPTKYQEIPTLPLNHKDPKGFYGNLLEESYYQGNGLGHLLYLQKMSDLYLNEKDHERAAHLLNNALILTMRLSLPNNFYHRYLLKKLERIEGYYLQQKCSLKTPARHQNYLIGHRQKLQEIRTGVKSQLEKGIPPQQIQQSLVEAFKNFLINLIKESIALLQIKPPTDFAFIGLGSMSRGEMAPYSDIEFAILIKENNCQTQGYFRRLSELLHLKIINLGESKYDPIRPRNKENGFTSSHNCTPHGFSLDAAGLSPLGKKGLYELIGTPKELAYFQTEEWHVRTVGSEVTLVNALTTYSLIMGEESLVADYENQILTILKTRPRWFKREKLREKRALELLKDHLKDFEPRLQEERLIIRAFNVKTDLYRPIQMIIGVLRLYYGLAKQNTFDLLCELVNQKIMSTEIAQILQKTLTHIVSLRLRVHLFYENELENLYYSRGSNDEDAQGLYVVQEEEVALLQEVYRTLIPLHRLAQAFLNGNQQAFLSATCYDAAVGTKPSEKISNYDSEEESYVQRAALNPNDPIALNDLSILKQTLGFPEVSLSYALDQLMILKNKYPNQSHPDIANTLNNIGYFYRHLGEFAKAVDYLKQALAMKKQLYGDGPDIDIANTLNNLGNAYSDLKDLQIALDYFKQALEMKQQIHLHSPHIALVIALGNIGATYAVLDDNTEAMNYCKQSLAMYEQLPHRKPLLNIAITLGNLGSIYKDTEEIDSAIECFERSLNMYKQLFGKRNHLNIAATLLSLGLLYKGKGATKNAISYFKQSLVMHEKLYEHKPHPTVAKVLTNLGMSYHEMKKYQKASSYFEQNLAINKKLYGNQPHQQVALDLYTLGTTYAELKNLPKAIYYLEQSLTMFEFLHKDEKGHPDISENLYHLGCLYQDSLNIEKACAYLKKSLAMNLKYYDHKPHPNTCIILDSLEKIYNSLEDYPEATKYCELNLKMSKQLYDNAPHIQISAKLFNLSILHTLQDRFERAIPYMEQSLVISLELHNTSPHSGISKMIVFGLNYLIKTHDRFGYTQKANAYRELKSLLVIDN